MKAKIISILLFLSIFAGLSASAQDPHFTQYFSNPLFLNPAYTGSVGCSRVALNFRDQWPQLSGNYVTYSASYDQYVKPLHGGLGIQVMTDRAGGGSLITSSVCGIYSFNINIKNYLHIRPAVSIGMGVKQIDWSEFGNGFIATTPNPPSNKYYFNAAAGLLVSYKNFTGGFSYDHINKPDIGFYSTSRLPSKITVHCNYQINMNENMYLNPSVIFAKQQDMEELLLGLMMKASFIKAGTGLRIGFNNPDAILLMLGFCSEKFSIGYSYDMTVSKLSNSTGGAHEISAIFKFNCKNDKENYKITSFHAF